MENVLFNKLGVMIDCSRNSVMTKQSVKDAMILLKSLGYNTIQLYTEDTYEVNNEPYFGYLRGRYTKEELKELDKFALSQGIELIPCVQTLAHLQKIFRWQPYWSINDCFDIILCENERTYQLIENIFQTLSECFTTRRVNIGMDEAHLLGAGQYDNIHSHKDRADILMNHLKKVTEIAGKYNFRCMMWGDMFFKLAFGGTYYIQEELDMPKEILDKVPHNVDLIYWDYYSPESKQYHIMSRCFKKFNNKIIFASGGWTWCGLVPSNRFGIKSNVAAINEVSDAGIDEMFVTLWGDDGGVCSYLSVLPTLFTISMINKGVNNEKEIKKLFKERFNVSFNDFMSIDSPNVLFDNQQYDGSNPSKYLFYNDPLLGAFDSVCPLDAEERFLKNSKTLKKMAKNEQFGFIFKPVLALNNCLYYKANLGIKIREAYNAKDKEQLKNIIVNKIKPLVKCVKNLYHEMDIYWHALYKPNGFEVIDYRLGGLLMRLDHIEKLLESFISNKVTNIELLEEKLLDYLGGVDEINRKAIGYNGFNTTVTMNSL